MLAHKKGISFFCILSHTRSIPLSLALTLAHTLALIRLVMIEVKDMKNNEDLALDCYGGGDGGGDPASCIANIVANPSLKYVIFSKDLMNVGERAMLILM